MRARGDDREGGSNSAKEPAKQMVKQGIRVPREGTFAGYSPRVHCCVEGPGPTALLQDDARKQEVPVHTKSSNDGAERAGRTEVPVVKLIRHCSQRNRSPANKWTSMVFVTDCTPESSSAVERTDSLGARIIDSVSSTQGMRSWNQPVAG